VNENEVTCTDWEQRTSSAPRVRTWIKCVIASDSNAFVVSWGMGYIIMVAFRGGAQQFGTYGVTKSVTIVEST
jgi:hypothetical protein